MKKSLLSLIICVIFLVSGCDRQKPILVLNSQPITKDTVNYFVQNFNPRQRINYALIMPKGFTDSVIRIQIVKKDEKVANWGYKIQQSQDICIDPSKKFYIGYVIAPEKGYYIMSIYEIKNLEKELSRIDFWVQ